MAIIMILYHRNYGRTWNSEITKKRGRLMLGLNNMPSRGYSHESNAIYLEEIHSELTEFYTSQLFLILTDCGNVCSLKVPSLVHSWTQASHRAQKNIEKCSSCSWKCCSFVHSGFEE